MSQFQSYFYRQSSLVDNPVLPRPRSTVSERDELEVQAALQIQSPTPTPPHLRITLVEYSSSESSADMDIDDESGRPIRRRRPRRPSLEEPEEIDIEARSPEDPAAQVTGREGEHSDVTFVCPLIFGFQDLDSLSREENPHQSIPVSFEFSACLKIPCRLL